MLGLGISLFWYRPFFIISSFLSLPPPYQLVCSFFLFLFLNICASLFSQFIFHCVLQDKRVGRPAMIPHVHTSSSHVFWGCTSLLRLLDGLFYLPRNVLGVQCYILGNGMCFFYEGVIYFQKKSRETCISGGSYFFFFINNQY